VSQFLSQSRSLLARRSFGRGRRFVRVRSTRDWAPAPRQFGGDDDDWWLIGGDWLGRRQSDSNADLREPINPISAAATPLPDGGGGVALVVAPRRPARGCPTTCPTSGPTTGRTTCPTSCSTTCLDRQSADRRSRGLTCGSRGAGNESGRPTTSVRHPSLAWHRAKSHPGSRPGSCPGSRPGSRSRSRPESRPGSRPGSHRTPPPRPRKLQVIPAIGSVPERRLLPWRDVWGSRTRPVVRCGCTAGCTGGCAAGCAGGCGAPCRCSVSPQFRPGGQASRRADTSP